MAKKPRKDLTGQKFGNWEVKRAGPDRLDSRGTRRPRWICECATCHKEYDVDQYALTDGRSRGCKECSKRRTFGRNAW